MEPEIEEVAIQLLRCPVGRNVLLTIERDHTPVPLAVTPRQAFARVAGVLRSLSPWSTRFQEAIATNEADQTRLTALAREVAADPGTHWWTAPMDRARQVLILAHAQAHGRKHPARTSSPNVTWEDYAERPEGWRVTSTLREEYSCLDAVIEAGVGDWMQGAPHRRFEASLDAPVRVCEISSPADWHTLVVAHPRINHGMASRAHAGTLVPDWRSVAKDWDGVHLTFMALLTVPFVRYRSAAGTTMMWSWNTEGTIWLPGAPIGAGSALRDMVDLPDATPFMVGQ